MFENSLEGFRKFYGKEEKCGRHPKFIKDARIFTLDVQYKLSLIYPTKLKSSKAQKFKSSKAQKLKNSKVQKLKNSKAQNLKSSKAQMLKSSKLQSSKGQKIKSTKLKSSPLGGALKTFRGSFQEKREPCVKPRTVC
jgi:hypothetical protein